MSSETSERVFLCVRASESRKIQSINSSIQKLEIILLSICSYIGCVKEASIDGDSCGISV